MMSLLRTLGAAFLLTAAAGANASSFIVTTDAVVDAVNAATRATSKVSSSLKDDKIVLAAREDAASFVASSGEIRGARLEGALQHIRQQLPELQATDNQLAQAILAI
ncbi:Outer membrane receptor protein, mostly Fe transport [Pseudomonas amygdali pv. morsprunorum]|nr:Outer membrane receptor protein, mostly Fe transport [Pseudomonas amygdali pv. morsprunorum]